MAKQGWAELYAWQLDRASRTPLSRQLYMQVRAGVLAGALAPGTKLPSSRAMASKLELARASVVAAYEQLLAEGYIEGRARIGHLCVGGSRRPRRPSGAARAALEGAADSGRGAGLRRVRAVDGAGRRAAVQHRPHAGRCAHGRRLAQADPSRRALARAARSRLHRPLRPDRAAAEHLRLPADRARGALRAGADRRHRRHPACDRHRHPRAARARRRGVGRGSRLFPDPSPAGARQGAPAADAGRCARHQDRCRASRVRRGRAPRS